jgi:hypothetical protein
MKLSIASLDQKTQKTKVNGTVEIGADGKLVITGWAQEFVDHYRRQLKNESGKDPTNEELLKAMAHRMSCRTAVSATLEE